DRVRRWIGAVGPGLLEGGEARLNRLPLRQVDIPLNDMLKRGASRGQGRLHVLERLFCLRANIPFANQITRCIESALCADIHGSDCSRPDPNIGVSWVIV